MSFFNIFKKLKGNGSLKSAIENLCKNEIVINMENTKVNNPSSSKVGGKPYLPSDFEWPVFTDKEDNKTRSLSFLCQINLEEVVPYDKDNVLPKSGMLYFFYECESSRWGFDADDKGAAKVFYYENLDGFISLDLPSDIKDEFKMPELAISFIFRKINYPFTRPRKILGVFFLVKAVSLGNKSAFEHFIKEKNYVNRKYDQETAPRKKYDTGTACRMPRCIDECSFSMGA